MARHATPRHVTPTTPAPYPSLCFCVWAAAWFRYHISHIPLDTCSTQCMNFNLTTMFEAFKMLLLIKTAGPGELTVGAAVWSAGSYYVTCTVQPCSYRYIDSSPAATPANNCPPPMSTACQTLIQLGCGWCHWPGRYGSLSLSLSC